MQALMCWRPVSAQVSIGLALSMMMSGVFINDFNRASS